MKAHAEMSRDSRIVEAILYLENEPVELDQLAQQAGFDRDRLEQALAELRIHYADGNHGVEIAEFAGGFHFIPKEDLWNDLKSRYGRKIDRRLSRSALETIAIIAYSQPVTKKEIENIRGVSADNIMRILQEKEYVQVIGRKDIIGRPFLYGTTRKFLQDFNLNSISALPRLEDTDRERFDQDE